jgi:hypothetical protein
VVLVAEVLTEHKASQPSGYALSNAGDELNIGRKIHWFL